MEDTSKNVSQLDTNHPDEGAEQSTEASTISGLKDADSSQPFFIESPVYEPESDFKYSDGNDIDNAATGDLESGDAATGAVPKRKLSEESQGSSSKILKLDHEEDPSTQTLDDEVSEITKAAKRKLDIELPPSTSRVRTTSRSSPRNASKRSNSVDITAKTPKTPKTPKSRSASADITTRKTPRKTPYKLAKEETDDEVHIINSDSSSRPSVEFVREIPPPQTIPETINEDSELNDSQDFHLVLSPTPDTEPNENKVIKYNSEPALVKDRNEILDAGKVHETKSDGYHLSDSSNILQAKEFRGNELESNDSTCTMESPDQIPSVASKLISKLSNGNSSTPTEEAEGKLGVNDITPDMSKLTNKGLKVKNESFRASNTTTPSTISPLQNGHSLPINTPQIPTFDVHVSHNEDGDFLSLYVVKTDSDLGMDMCKEYQRISKRFTIDPYLGDVSVSNSPSSVTSGGMINLPNRTSFASSISSTSTSSNRTSDGAFVVPQPPRKSVVNPTSTVKGYDAVLKKIQDLFSHIRDASDDGSRSINDDKISVGIQTSLSEAGLSNGNASPEEVNKCDKATPKSSLKKTRVRGRRPIAGKAKRALLPTQLEEPEYMHEMNSPEMVSTNGDTEKMSPIKSPKDEKPLSSLVGTPKSVSKLKQKRRSASPRPATSVEKAIIKTDYPGYAPDTVVLAKWVDKRYYSGKVLEITEPNKYLIKFDDGQSKVLLDDFIIFGDMKRLPLQGQSVYAMMDEEQNYEPGLVLGVEENDSGTVTYKCMADGDTVVLVTASELYLTEDQARSIKESARPHSPASPATPRRRHHRELDLDNIIQGPRSARSRDKGSSSAKKRVASPKSPKASTSGINTVSKSKSTPVIRKRPASESSEMSESSNSAPPVRLEEVPGVEPEVQRTPRKIDGVKVGPFQLKGAAKQTVGKKNSKLAKFSDDSLSSLGPIPTAPLFESLHFLLTCTLPPRERLREREREREKAKKGEKDREREKSQDTRHYSSEEDGETTSTMAGTDTEDLVFCDRPFNKERLKEQLEAGGGVVYSHFDDIPKNKYSVCRIIAPRPCLTAKYIQCIAADIRAMSHAWVIMSCVNNRLLDADAYALPTGFSLLKDRYIDWVPTTGRRNTTFFKEKTVLLCGDQDTFVKFWERVCTLAGANTRVVNEEDLNMSGAIALVTECDCPHEVQNKANQDNIPLVSTHWVIQCLIEGRVIPPTSHDKFSFMYSEQE